MAKTILLVHGRHFKPPEDDMRQLWIDALRHGVQRDHADAIDAFDAATIEFVYYGDLSNDFLRDALGKPPANDLDDRREALSTLQALPRDQFDRATYDALPGKSNLGEFAADMLGRLFGILGLAGPLIDRIAPDIREYWNPETAFGSQVRGRFVEPLRAAIDREDQIMIIAHSLGSIIAYDTLWKFSHTCEYRPGYTGRTIDRLITLGSPLGDTTIQRILKGSEAHGARCYPGNIHRWINIAAVGDYIAHDETLADDYRRMIDMNLVDSITDERIYNVTIRRGRSNPHSSVGYLIHPTTANAVAQWLTTNA